LNSNTLQLIAFGLTMLVTTIMAIGASIFLAPKGSKNKVKLETYECGETPIGEGRPIFKMQYFSYAIYFTIIDVALAFMIVFLMAFTHLNGLNALYVFLFFTVISLGLLYSWRGLRR
jgi:NADH-quinone oxidoreductase subunit A